MAQTVHHPRGFGFDFETLDPIHWATISLAALTGVIHLYLFLDQGFIPFLLAAAGFFAGIISLVMTRGLYRLAVYFVGIPFTFIQIVGYFIIEQPTTLADISVLAAFDKITQAMLIAILCYLLYIEWEKRHRPLPSRKEMNPR